MANNSSKKLTLVSLILMIFTSVFGFTNIPRSFYLMGYGAIPWFILSALFFFIPYAFMMAEYGAAFRSEKGGIYSWMAKSVGPKYAFVGTFMWYASYIIWMVNVSSGIWIPLSNAIFGSDKTKSWQLTIGGLHLGSVQLIGILAIIWIIFVSYISSHGLDKIKKITSVGGTAVAALNIVLLVGAVIVFIGNKGQLAEPIHSATSFINSPNPDYQTTLGMLSFLVFAIFAYGGIEVVGGLVDETENAEVTFPKGIAISAIIISIGYAIGIFLCGIFTNWAGALSSSDVHMANVAYVLMQNLGVQIGLVFGTSAATAQVIGDWIARFAGLSMFLALTGAFFTLTYAPLKQLIEGTPKKLWPGKIGELKDGMPKFAMLVQAVIVIFMIAVISFGGSGASEFFNKLVLMTNVAMTIPYMFLSFAFISFKKNDSIKKPFEVFKNKNVTIIATIVVSVTVLFANIFTIIKPAIVDNNMSETLWMIGGPIGFTIIALLLYRRYEKKYLNNSEYKNNENNKAI